MLATCVPCIFSISFEQTLTFIFYALCWLCVVNCDIYIGIFWTFCLHNNTALPMYGTAFVIVVLLCLHSVTMQYVLWCFLSWYILYGDTVFIKPMADGPSFSYEKHGGWHRQWFSCSCNYRVIRIKWSNLTKTKTR